MRVSIGDKLATELTPEQEKAINPYRQEARVSGLVMSEPTATAAYIGETRQFYAILAGIVFLATLALGLLAGPGEEAMVYSTIVACNLLLWLFLVLILRRRIATWKAAVGQRELGLAPAGTVITVDDKGLDVGGKLHPWDSLRIDQVDLTDLTAKRTPLFLIERLSLATSSEVVVLDAMLIGKGRLIVGNAWRRLRALK